ncbi:hypothetical protein BV20DRAFT_64932 [Pilatotrama ljubarskyi]|nr:hypothetical protein BV20DRAFT_64932 [Pilatotrama ljubarskyi]
MPSTGHQPVVRLGGTPALGLFVASLFAFVAETQLSQYVQADLGFRQPFLIFYIVHSSFTILFPLHLLYLHITSQHSVRSLWASVLHTLRRQLSQASSATTAKPNFPTWRFCRFLAVLTTGLTLPGLLWFIAVTLAPVTDVTALWNTNAFFAYVFSVVISGGKWDVRRLVPVTIATAGVLAVVYGGSTVPGDTSDAVRGSSVAADTHRGAPLVGDLLTLVASMIYAAYQVLYKIYVALPNDPEVQSDTLYSPLSLADSSVEDLEDPVEEPLLVTEEIIHPLPFGLYPNFWTSAIGLCTLLVLWIPVPLLDAFDIEPFEMPRTALTYGVIAGIALTGAIFNAGFMVLLGAWGPIVTSVGSLLTIVLVFVSDAIFGGAVETVTIWSVLGCGSIVAAFAILAYDLTKER